MLNSITSVLLNPASTMVHIWLLILILRVVMPFSYTKTVDVLTVIFVIACISAFIIGHQMSAIILFRSKLLTSRWKNKHSGTLSFVNLDRIIRISAIVGIIGASLVVLAKVFLTGLDFSDGVSSARINRANEVLTNTASDTPLLMYPGLLAFPFGVTSFLLSLMQNEGLSSKTLILSRLGFFSPIAVAVVNGGRGSVVQTISMVLIALLIKSRTQVKHIENSVDQLKKKAAIKFYAIVGGISAFAYNSYIFQSRRSLTGKSEFLYSLTDWEQNYWIYPHRWLIDLVDTGLLNGDLLLDSMGIYYYFTHGLSVLNVLINSPLSLGPFYGQSQVALLAPLLNKLSPDFSLFEEMIGDLSQVGAAGLFSTAWGMMFLDVGLWGTVLESFILGWISGRIYYSAIIENRLSYQLLFCFVILSVIFTPISSPLGFSDASFLLIAIIFTWTLLERNSVSIE